MEISIIICMFITASANDIPPYNKIAASACSYMDQTFLRIVKIQFYNLCSQQRFWLACASLQVSMDHKLSTDNKLMAPIILNRLTGNLYLLPSENYKFSCGYSILRVVCLASYTTINYSLDTLSFYTVENTRWSVSHKRKTHKNFEILKNNCEN